MGGVQLARADEITEMPVYPDANGWDRGKFTNPGEGGINEVPGIYNPYGFAKNDDSAVTDGFSTVRTHGTSSMMYAYELDVTKPIRFSYTASIPVAPDPGNERVTSAWIFMSIVDDWKEGVTYGYNIWQAPNNENVELCIGFHDIDLTTVDGNMKSGAYGHATLDSNLVNTAAAGYESGDVVAWEVYFGATAEEGYIKLNGTEVGAPTLTQGDFTNNRAWFHFATEQPTDMRIKLEQPVLEQPVEYGVSVTESAHASASVSSPTAEEGETVTVNVTPEEGYRVLWVKATENGVAKDAARTSETSFTFVKGAGDAVVTYKADTVEPSPMPAAPEQNGWDKGGFVEGINDFVSAGRGWYGLPEVYSSNADGFSSFRTHGNADVSNVNILDVSKPIKFYYKATGQDGRETADWIYFDIADDWRNLVYYGAAACNYPTTQFSLGVKDLDLTEGMEAKQGATLDPEAVSGITVPESGINAFEVYFGATAEEGYIKLNGVKIGAPTAVQSDFGGGRAYFHVGVTQVVNFEMKLAQDFAVDVTKNEGGTVRILSGGEEVTSAEYGAELTLVCTADSGYRLSKVTINGTEMTSLDGEYTFRCGFASPVIAVEFENFTYTVSFVSVDGETQTVKVASGEKVTPPEDPVRRGYTFAGWFSGLREFDFNTPIEEDITLTARWEICTYTVTFQGEGIETWTQQIEYKKKAQTPDIPVREGYTFDGWYLDGEKFDFDTEIREDITLVAQWTEEAGGCAGTVSFAGLLPAGAVAVAAAAAAILRRKKSAR